MRSGLLDEASQPHPQHPGVLLRPYLHRGMDGRLGYRRNHGSRPLSDPGVALHLPPYPPPPFPDAFMPMGYPDAFPGYLWGPPPPYSQPTSTENIPSVTATAGGSSTSPSHVIGPQSPTHHHELAPMILSPMHRPPTLADLIRGTTTSPTVRGISSPNNSTDIHNSPGHILSRPPRARHKASDENIVSNGDGEDEMFDGTNSLPLRHRARRLPLGHVKSLGDVTENKHDESLDVIFCDGKEISSLDKIRNEIIDQKAVSKHLKSISDPKSVYSIGKGDPESEIYFADVSSCVSLRPNADEVMYYSDPTSSGSQQYSVQQQIYQDPSQNYIGTFASSISSSHMYEQVREGYDEGDTGSHHTSDDTMIVHTSSSDHSLAGDTDAIDTENTYSIISPATDLSSSASPMVTDTDAYSCYTPIMPNSSKITNVTSPPENERNNFPTGTPLRNTCATSPNSIQNLNDVVLLSKGSIRSALASAKTNLNLHNPLHPVHHPQHQAYHHQLSHNYKMDNISNVNKGKRDGNVKSSKKSPGKKCRKSKKDDSLSEPRYESVDAPPESIVNKHSHPSKCISSNIADIEARLPSTHGHIKFEKSTTQSSKSSQVHNQKVSSASSQSPTKHKQHHRQHTHHRHPHPHPLQQSAPNCSSSSSSSLSSPCSPTTILPQDVSSDLNGNVPSNSSTNSNSPESSTATSIKATEVVNSHEPNSNSTAVVGTIISSKNILPTNSNILSTAVDNKTKLKCIIPSESTSPVKKQRSNLSLPLRKLVDSSDPEKSSFNQREEISNTPTKVSCKVSKNCDKSLVSHKEGHKKKNTDRECKANYTSDSKRKSSKESKSDSKQDIRSPGKTDNESKFIRKARKSKQESSTCKAASAYRHEQHDDKVSSKHKETSPSKTNKASVDKGEVTAEASDARASGSRRPANVQQLLQNLKSVNV